MILRIWLGDHLGGPGEGEKTGFIALGVWEGLAFLSFSLSAFWMERRGNGNSGT